MKRIYFEMRRFCFMLMGMVFCCTVNGQESKCVIESDKEVISLTIGKIEDSWQIDTELDPDILHVYCKNNDMLIVKFNSGIDSIEFEMTSNKTIEFAINYKGETANIKVICSSSVSNQINANSKVFGLSRLWSEAKYNFIGMDRLTFNWDSLYLEYIPKVMQSENDYQYKQLLLKFYASLNDGHTNVYDSNEFYYFRDYLPLSLESLDNESIFISNISMKSTLDSTFVGAKLIELFGIEPRKYIRDSIMPFVSSTTDHVKFAESVQRLQTGFKNEQFRATVQKTDGTVHDICLDYNGKELLCDDDGYGRQYDDLDYPVHYDKISNSIIYLAVQSFSQEKYIRNFISKHVSEINAGEGLILDLRDNRGGSTHVAWFIQSLLTPPEKKWFLNYGWQTRVNDGVKKANGNWVAENHDFYKNKALRTVNPDTVFISDTLKRIEVPIVVLINKYTASAAEDFLVNLYELPYRPVFIGEKTCGSTGSPLVINDLPNRWFARVCTRRILYPYSMEPFLDGIEPDISVTYTVNEYINNVDKEVNAAVNYLHSIK